MKNKVLNWRISTTMFAILILSIPLAFAQNTYDDFESGSISTSLWSTTGSPSASTTQVKEGTYSAKLPTTGDRIKNATHILNWTNTVISLWVYQDSASASDTLYGGGCGLLFDVGYPVSDKWGYNAGSWVDTGVSATSGRGDVSQDWVQLRFLVNQTDQKVHFRIGDTESDDAYGAVWTGCGGTSRNFWVAAQVHTSYVDNVTYWDYDTYGWNGSQEQSTEELPFDLLYEENFDSFDNWTGGCSVSGGKLICDGPTYEAVFIHELPNVTENTNNWSIEFDMALTACSSDFGPMVFEKEGQGGDLAYGVHSGNPVVDSPLGESFDQALTEVQCDGGWHHWKIVFFQNGSVGTYIGDMSDLDAPDSMMDYSSRAAGKYFQFSRNLSSSYELKADHFLVYNGTATDYCFRDSDDDGFYRFCTNATPDCDDNNATVRPAKDGETVTGDVRYCPRIYSLPTGISCGGHSLHFGDTDTMEAS